MVPITRYLLLYEDTGAITGRAAVSGAALIHSIRTKNETIKK
jgi:hypothetical protein